MYLSDRLPEQCEITAPPVANKTQNLGFAPVVVNRQRVHFFQQLLGTNTHFFKEKGRGVERKKERMVALRAGQVQLKMDGWRLQLHRFAYLAFFLGSRGMPPVVKYAARQQTPNGRIHLHRHLRRCFLVRTYRKTETNLPSRDTLTRIQFD